MLVYVVEGVRKLEALGLWWETGQIKLGPTNPKKLSIWCLGKPEKGSGQKVCKTNSQQFPKTQPNMATLNLEMATLNLQVAGKQFLRRPNGYVAFLI